VAARRAGSSYAYDLPGGATDVGRAMEKLEKRWGLKQHEATIFHWIGLLGKILGFYHEISWAFRLFFFPHHPIL